MPEKSIYHLENCHIYLDGDFHRGDVTIEGGKITLTLKEGEGDGPYVFPGFADVHVHLREPGFGYKETIKTGTLAAAHGGYVAVCPMPNLSPAPDGADTLGEELAIIQRDACIHVLPYGTITKERQGETLSHMEAMAELVAGFSDDGSGIQGEGLMRAAMEKAKSLGKMIVAHCEDLSLIQKGGCIHDGTYAKEHGLVGISSESEWRQIERDLLLAEETGCAYHVCHISTKESVDLIRRAKARGVDVTCETAPHYLLLSDKDLRDEGRFKMNPPLRDESDRLALLEGLKDGTIDMIATDHAPHSAEEKGKGLQGSAMGIVGLENAFPVLYTGLVKTGVISFAKLIELLCISPAKRFSLPVGYDKGCLCAFDLERAYPIDPESFLSMGRATPFAGDMVQGECLLTVCGGRVVYEK